MKLTNNSGIILVGLIVMVVLAAIVFSTAVYFSGLTIDEMRNSETREKLHAIETAVVGNPYVTHNDAGGDMGHFDRDTTFPANVAAISDADLPDRFGVNYAADSDAWGETITTASDGTTFTIASGQKPTELYVAIDEQNRETVDIEVGLTSADVAYVPARFSDTEITMNLSQSSYAAPVAMSYDAPSKTFLKDNVSIGKYALELIDSGGGSMTLTPAWLDSGGGATSTVVTALTVAPTDTTERMHFDVAYPAVPDTVFFLHSDTTDGSTTFTDASSEGDGGSGHTITANGSVHHETDQQRYGATAVYFDGVTDCLEIVDHADFHFGVGAFSIDCWVRFDIVGDMTPRTIVSQWDETVEQIFLLWKKDTDIIEFLADMPLGTHAISLQSTTVVSADTWYHIAVTYDGTTAYLFIDGVAEDTTTPGAFSFLAPTVDILCGAQWGSLFGLPGTVAYEHKGYIDQLRVSKGFARWTEDFDDLIQ